MSRFLSPADLLDLTGYTRRDAQARWLAEHGYKFDLRADGSPAVLLRCWDMPAATRRAGFIVEVAKLWSR